MNFNETILKLISKFYLKTQVYKLGHKIVNLETLRLCTHYTNAHNLNYKRAQLAQAVTISPKQSSITITPHVM